jgi:hypothetical protein
MAGEKNLFGRAMDALMASRERQAQRYVAQLERDWAPQKDKLSKR